jgi:anti-sigma factor RsiW
MSARGRDGGGEAPEALSGEDLVALLYGELDGEEAARTGARVEADPALSARLGEMRRVRELFSSMADEEPPSRLTAQLLAEAARSAPQVRSAAAPAEAGLWARFVSWLQPLVQRPALAAAASLVLVAGVAGVLYMRKGEELTSTAPESKTASTAPEDRWGEATAKPEPPPPPITAATPADTGSAESGAQGQADESAGAEIAKSEAAKPARESSRRKKAVGGVAGGDKNRSFEKAPPRPAVKSGTVYGLSEQEMVPREEPPAANQAGPGGGGAAPEQKKADDRGPAAEPAPAPQATPPPADTKPSAPRADARTLHQRAIDAALDQRCDEVRSLAGQVRAADPSYYAKSFVTDTRLKGCLSGGSTKKATKK